jgi:hypothetical protein
MAHPLGLVVNGDPYVRSPRQVTDTGVAFFSGTKAGTTLSVMSSTDIVAETRDAIAHGTGGRAAALINFNCILRTLDLNARGLGKAYGDVFTDLPTIGFSTYGEAYVGHVNQTATMLMLK